MRMHTPTPANTHKVKVTWPSGGSSILRLSAEHWGNASSSVLASLDDGDFGVTGLQVADGRHNALDIAELVLSRWELGDPEELEIVDDDEDGGA